MNTELWRIERGAGPFFAAANHNGHELRPELAEICALDEATRLREEDPFTELWAPVVPNFIIPLRSRFEVDLNRAREEAFYLEPKNAWGLNLWREKPGPEMIQRSLGIYDQYYEEVKSILVNLESRHRRFVVFDLHSYNHRRDGPDAPPADPRQNPEVNVGTGTMNRSRWAPLVDRFIRDLSSFDFMGRHLDVRENVKFRGRQFPRWIHESFPDSGCALAIEFKKIFMDEWTGKADPAVMDAFKRALQSTIPGLREELEKL